jgi:hypothetical protein
VDRKGAGNDFEIDPDPEHGFEIFNWQLRSGSIQSVSKSIIWAEPKGKRLPSVNLKVRHSSYRTESSYYRLGCSLRIADTLEISGMMPREPNDKISQQNEFIRNWFDAKVPQTIILVDQNAEWCAAQAAHRRS